MLVDYVKFIEYLDVVFDNQYLTDALIGIDQIYEYIVKNKENATIELAEAVKENPEYKFKDLTLLLNHLEKTLYAILLKLQSISQVAVIHKLCVKYFLAKGKVILALKSLNYLERTNSDNIEYMEALIVFKNFCVEKKDTLNNPLYMTLIADKVDLANADKKIENAKTTILATEKRLVPNTILRLRMRAALAGDDKEIMEILKSVLSEESNLIFRSTKTKVI